jgi:hypothetical protein
MPSSVLTDDFRQQLEQQRERLTTERSAIVQAALDQATADIDRSLDYINALLDGFVASSTNRASNGSYQATSNEVDVESETEDASPQRRVSRKQAAAFSNQKVDKPASTSLRNKSNIKVKSATESKGKARSQSDKPFEAPKLKREFKDLTPAKAMEQVMRAAPEQIFTTDEMIQVLFGSLDDSVLPRTRQSVALMFSHGLRRQDYIKVQENPAQYKLNPDQETESE